MFTSRRYINGFLIYNIETYISLTLHYINSKFESHNITLDIKELPTLVSCETVLNCLVDIMSEWKIPHEGKNRIYFIAENTEMIKGVISCEETWQKIPCLFQIIEESVLKAINDCKSFIDLLSKCVKIVEHFKKNYEDNERLEKLISTEESVKKIK